MRGRRGWKPSGVIRLGPGRLRAAAEVVRRATGLRVEILPAALPRCGKHLGSVRTLGAAIGPCLPAGLVAAEAVSVRVPDGDDPDGHLTPDLTVCPLGFLDSDETLIHPREVEFAAEVVTRSAEPQEIVTRIGRYATAAVRVLLLTDPGEGVWALYTRPEGSAYRATLHGVYGEEIPLPEPLGFRVATERLPRYGTRGGAGG